jgi:hypothetical protein
MQISLKSSKKLILLFGMMHLVLCFSVLLSYAPWWLQTPAIVACVFSFIYVMRRYVWLTSNNAVVKLILDEQQQWRLLLNDGRILQTSLTGDSVVLPFFSILNFDCGRKSLSVLLATDSVVEDLYRRLCVSIRTSNLL